MANSQLFGNDVLIVCAGPTGLTLGTAPLLRGAGTRAPLTAKCSDWYTMRVDRIDRHGGSISQSTLQPQFIDVSRAVVAPSRAAQTLPFLRTNSGEPKNKALSGRS